MRITLMIDIETEDIDRLQKYVGEQPLVKLVFDEGMDCWAPWGRFVGAKKAEGLPEATAGGP